MKFVVHDEVHQGKRDYQEDSCAILDLPNNQLAVCMCDGLGGYAGGDRASQLAVSKFLAMTTEAHNKEQKKLWCTTVSDELVAIGNADRKLSKISTTGIIGTFTEDRLSFVSVGDSYVLAFADGKLHRLNIRHETPHGGLTSFLGWGLTMMNFDEVPVKPGDIFIFASDGIETLDDDEVVKALASGENKAKAIVDAALEKQHAYQDNISVITVEIQ